jgi:outer membrane cobalamin receptor
LEAETAYTYETGVEQALPGKSKMSLTGFWIDTQNFIEKNDQTNLYQNNQKYQFKGVELTAETLWLHPLLLKAGYTYLDAKDKSDGTQIDDLQYRPKHKFTLEGEYTSKIGFSAYASLRYLVEQYTYSNTLPLQKVRLNDIAVVDLKVEQALFKGFMRVYLRVENLFDANYEESYGYPQAGRLIYGGVSFRF